jgi:hypothetical protein
MATTNKISSWPRPGTVGSEEGSCLPKYLHLVGTADTLRPKHRVQKLNSLRAGLVCDKVSTLFCLFYDTLRKKGEWVMNDISCILRVQMI